MFPIRESSKYLAMATAVLLIIAQLLFLGLRLGEEMKPRQIEGLKDNWELISSIQLTQKEEPGVKAGEEAERAYTAYSTINSEKLGQLAEKYHAEPDYLDYIIQVEKTFNLEPCELLAVIAQESGFKPQTHMDGGSLSYSTTQMKMATAKTAYMAITEYYKLDIPEPTHELLNDNKYYAAFLAGGYLRYLHDVYQDKYESYTAYNWGIGGRMTFYKNNGHFKSAYALKVADLGESFQKYIGKDYYLLDSAGQNVIDTLTFSKNA